MLQSLDVLVGFATVMLLLSMVVTATTHYITAVSNSRGRHLRDGLTQLLQQLHPDFAGDPSFAKQVADAMLQHPLIGRSSWLGKRIPALSLGTVIQREEVTRLLMDLANGEGATNLDGAPAAPAAEPAADPVAAGVGSGAAVAMAPAPSTPQFGSLTMRLRKILADLGISDPGATLDKVRTITLKLEKKAPELSNSARQTLAMLQAAESKFVGRIHGWFDQTMDRVSERFTQHARIVTVCVALAVAFLTQLDSLALISRLSVDKDLRTAIVNSAGKVTAAYDAANVPTPPAEPAGGPATAPATAPAGGGTVAATTLKDAQREYYSLLSARGLISFPWAAGWKPWWAQLRTWKALPGILLTAVFLSLGAPFWYGALKNLLRFRSLLTQKDDAQRVERQSTQAAEPSASSPAPTGGDDPTAVG